MPYRIYISLAEDPEGGIEIAGAKLSFSARECAAFMLQLRAVLDFCCKDNKPLMFTYVQRDAEDAPMGQAMMIISQESVKRITIWSTIVEEEDSADWWKKIKDDETGLSLPPEAPSGKKPEKKPAGPDDTLVNRLFGKPRNERGLN